MIMPTFLRSIQWGHQHLLSFEPSILNLYCFVSCMKSSNSQFNLICKPSNSRHHICINSCLILFCLACLLLKLIIIYHMWQDLLYLRLCISISHLIHKIFTCHFESHHRSKQAFANIRSFISITNTLLYFPFIVLLVTYTLYQWDKHACLQHMSHLF